jgi:diadenylate cyclase
VIERLWQLLLEFWDFLGGSFDPVRDTLDIVIVTLGIYWLLLLIRGTRAVQVLVGILVLFGVAAAARYLGLRTLQTVLNGFFILLPFAGIVLFQNEIRRALTAFGKNPLVRFGHQERIEASLQEVVLAVTTLSSRRIGGLIVIERLQGLREYIENGIRLDAIVSYDLLLTIFDPTTPLHDGAVILEEDRLAAAACFLPLSSNPSLSTRSGTRHRAALGVSEETDALAVVVSEETGRISVAVDGELHERLDARGLRGMLYRHLVTPGEESGRRPRKTESRAESAA